jgi:DNA-binding MarR family transcriptional regulator
MPYKLQEWPDERLRHLTELWPDPRYSINAIARELGTDPGSVKRRAKFLALKGRRTNSLAPWLVARRELLSNIGRDSDR